jgi:DNA repair protein RecO (recombination protein O)
MPSRDRIYRTEAVVLRRQDLGEADRLITAFSPEYGKLRLVAKGVRRPRSRKSGHLEPFTRVMLLLARGRDLDIITQAEAIDLYANLRTDLLRVGHAAYVIELLDKFTVASSGENQALYRLLLNSLDRLNVGAEPGSTVLYYELRLLDLVGYRPQLFQCVGCSAEIRPQDQYFSPEEGGILCSDCGRQRPGSRRISLAALKVLRHFQRSTYASSASVSIRQSVSAEVDALLEDYLSYLLERRLNAPGFLRHVRRLMHVESANQPEG